MIRSPMAPALLVGVASVLAAADAAIAGAQVPFKGRLDGTVTHADGEPGIDLVTVTGGGEATELGRFTFVAPHAVNTSTRTATGTYEFTAANGDMVFASFTGAASPTTTPGVLAIVETATITGGTGRFADATGGFVVNRLYDRPADTTWGSFSGTISSPRAGRS